MGLANGVHGGSSVGNFTESAGTVIDALVVGKPGFRTRIPTLKYVSDSTAHTLTIMRVLGDTTLSAAAASGQAVIDIVADPGSIAANDYVVLEDNEGAQHLRKVSSVSTLEITLTANVPSALNAGNKMYFLGIVGDTGHLRLLPTVSVTTTYQDEVVGIAENLKKGEPLVVNSTNETGAGTIELVTSAYTNE